MSRSGFSSLSGHEVDDIELSSQDVTGAIELSTNTEDDSLLPIEERQRIRAQLPTIPKGPPPKGDKIDVETISRVYDEAKAKAKTNNNNSLHNYASSSSIIDMTESNNTTTRKRTSPSNSSSSLSASTTLHPLSQDPLSATTIQPALSTANPARPARFDRGAEMALRSHDVLRSNDGGLEELDDEFGGEYGYEPPPRRRPQRKLPLKTAGTAFFLLFIGVLFSSLGLGFLFTKGLHDATPFLIIGGIGFIPGSYVSFIIYRAYMGHPGFSYDQIPTYDD